MISPEHEFDNVLHIGTAKLAVLAFMLREYETAPFFKSDIINGTHLPGGSVYPALHRLVETEFVEVTLSEQMWRDPRTKMYSKREQYGLTAPGYCRAIDVVAGYFLPNASTPSVVYRRRVRK